MTKCWNSSLVEEKMACGGRGTPRLFSEAHFRELVEFATRQREKPSRCAFSSPIATHAKSLAIEDAAPGVHEGRGRIETALFCAEPMCGIASAARRVEARCDRELRGGGGGGWGGGGTCFRVDAELLAPEGPGMESGRGRSPASSHGTRDHQEPP